MKTFEQLTLTQRKEMIDLAFYELVEHIVKGHMDVTLTSQASQTRLEGILTAARRQEKPRIATLTILRDKPIRKELTRLAIVAASGSQYDDAGEPITKVSHNEINQYFFKQEQGNAIPPWDGKTN